MTPSSKAAIAERLAEARERTLALIEPLDDEQLNRVYSPILSPLAWDLGHIANFEELWLVQTIGGREPLHGELGRFYDAIENPRKTRGELPILRDAELRAYLADVRERTLEVLDEVEIGADAEDPLLREGFVYEMLLAHEQQHNETMLQLLQMVDGYEPAGSTTQLAPPSRSRPGPEMVAIEGGEYEIGAPARGFAYDNERPRHAVELAAFEIDRTPVTNGAYIAVHGGDRRRAAAVLGARRRGRLGRRPRWAAATRSTRPSPSSTSPGTRPTPSPAGPASGCRPSTSGRRRRPQLEGVGHAWEWTSSDFLAYPGFEAFPYREYSEVFFGDELQGAARRLLGDPPRRRSGPASATGTCRSAARSSPACAARGTHESRSTSTSTPTPRRRWRATSAPASRA